MSILDQLAAQWMAAKVTEKQAVEFRRTAEDAILSELKLNSAEGVTTHNAGPFEIKITNRVSHKVDSKKVQEIAAENDLQEHLSTLFRRQDYHRSIFGWHHNHARTGIIFYN